MSVCKVYAQIALTFASAGQHSEERTQCQALTAENERLKSELEKEDAAHSRAVNQYVTEVEARSRVHSELLQECEAIEHSLVLPRNTEKRCKQLQVREAVKLVDAPYTFVTRPRAAWAALVSLNDVCCVDHCSCKQHLICATDGLCSSDNMPGNKCRKTWRA